MKTVLCFGDSNTFGTNSELPGERVPWDKRWTGVLQTLLGEEWRVIEEGLGGRTTVFDDPLSPNRCGIAALPMLLDTHSPLDAIIVMLGTNDWKARFAALPDDVAAGVGRILQTIVLHPFAQGQTPSVLVVSPILVSDKIESSIYTGFTKQAAVNSKLLAPLLKKQAQLWHADFLNAADYVTCGSDQLHIAKNMHPLLAQAIAEHFFNK